MIGVTQRVEFHPQSEEIRDALDQRWAQFLFACDLPFVLLPNHKSGFALAKRCSGFLLTGGNSIGEALMRDQFEIKILEYALERALPLLGVCRGMQLIQHFFGVPLQKIEGHVRSRHLNERNSFHDFGSYETVEPLEILERAEDGIVEAIWHTKKPLIGMMWHPEREESFDDRDRQLFKGYYSSGGSRIEDGLFDRRSAQVFG